MSLTQSIKIFIFKKRWIFKTLERFDEFKWPLPSQFSKVRGSEGWDWFVYKHQDICLFFNDDWIKAVIDDVLVYDGGTWIHKAPKEMKTDIYEALVSARKYLKSCDLESLDKEHTRRIEAEWENAEKAYAKERDILMKKYAK